MIRFIWKLFKSIFGALFAVVRPLRRLVCRRQKHAQDDLELVSIGSGNADLNYSKEKNEPESWDVWDEQGTSNPSDGTNKPFTNGLKTDLSSRGYGKQSSFHLAGKPLEPDNEPEVNFFEDMTPEVKKQPKILIRKKNSEETHFASGLLNRFSAMSDIPLANSELEAWEEENNAWDTEEISEDLTWQAVEAIKERKRMERIERQVEQQKKKLKKDEMRNIKGGSLVVTKLS